MFPEIHLSDSFILPTYIVYLSLLYCGLIVYVARRADHLRFSRAIALDLGFVLMVAGFLGGRLFHVFYERPDIYLAEPTRILKFWEGGFVFYGGFLSAVAAGGAFVSWRKLSFRPWADFFAPVGSLGYALGRISCFLSGCCYGRSCDLPWAVEGRHPTQLYAVFSELLVYAFLLWLAPKNYFRSRPGSLFFLWMALHGLGRLIMENYRDDFRGALWLRLSISSWISLALMAAGLCALIWNRKTP